MSWEPLGLSGIAAFVVAVPLAATLYFGRPTAPLNRRLAFLLLVHGLNWLVYAGIRPMAASPRSGYAINAVFLVTAWLVAFAVARFIGTLETPLARPFRSRILQGALLACAISLAMLMLLFEQRFGPVIAPFEGVAGWRLADTTLPGFFVYESLVNIALLLASVVVTMSAARRARFGAARRQARWMAWGFAIHDAVFLSFIAVIHFGLLPAGQGTTAFMFMLPTLNFIALILVLSYAVLRDQILGIHLRIKVGINRTTVVGLFAGIVFVGSELVEQAFGVDQTLPALLVAALVALGLKPLQLLGHKVADLCMPEVQDTAAYRQKRRVEIYAAALEHAIEDRVIHPAERRILDGLRVDLGLSERQTAAIERDLRPTT